MGKTIWIDRVAVAQKSGFGGGGLSLRRHTPTEFDYSVHLVEDGEEITEENVVQHFPEQVSGGYGFHNAEELAKRLGALTGASVKMAWLEGQIHFRVSVMVPVVAGSAEEAQQMVHTALFANPILARARLFAEEGR